MTNEEQIIAQETYKIAIRSVGEHLALSGRVKDESFHQCLDGTTKASQSIAFSLDMGKKLMVCGNGSAAADAMHIAIKFASALERHLQHSEGPIALALEGDFASQVAELGVEKDVLVGLSASEDSPKIISAFEAAKNAGVITIAMTGENGGKLAALSDLAIKVPSDISTIVQEIHISLGHSILAGVHTLLSMGD